MSLQQHCQAQHWMLPPPLLPLLFSRRSQYQHPQTCSVIWRRSS
jgi:hypothetical protein